MLAVGDGDGFGAVGGAELGVDRRDVFARARTRTAPQIS